VTAGDPFVIAIDAGGTFTRVGCFGLDGVLLAGSRGRGGSPTHNHDAAGNVASAVSAALDSGGLDPGDAVALAAGSAGISRRGSNQGTGDNAWADDYYTFPALTCPRSVVNDAVIAHRGALVGGPGVIVVAGTGSMILAITAAGEEIESGQFEHYAGGARHLVFEAMHRLLSGSADRSDDSLIREVLAFWGAADLAELRQVVLRLGGTDREELKRRYGALAPMITAAADGSSLADSALRELAARTARGVHVLAPLVATESTERTAVSVAGSLATDPAFGSRLADALAVIGAPATRLVPPRLDPLGGAAILAYELAGLAPERIPAGRLAETTSAPTGTQATPLV